MTRIKIDVIMNGIGTWKSKLQLDTVEMKSVEDLQKNLNRIVTVLSEFSFGMVTIETEIEHVNYKLESSFTNEARLNCQEPKSSIKDVFTLIDAIE